MSTPHRSSSRTAILLPFVVLLGLLSAGATATPAQEKVTQANYELAARFTNARMRKLTFDSRVTPRWLESSDRFWYRYETSDGAFFWMVDPELGTREPLFDNVKMAAALTRLTKDPYDHQHLPITTVKFVRDSQAFTFKVTSSQDEKPAEDAADTEKKKDDGDKKDDQEKDKPRRKRPKKKVFHFEYDLGTQELTELVDYEEPLEKLDWASVSPDGAQVVFARNHNLFMIDAENYKKAQEHERAKKEEGADEKDEDAKEGEEEDEEEVELDEVQLTEDGEEHFSYGSSGRGETEEEKKKSAKKRQAARGLLWSRDSKKFAVVRTDMREVKDLWVINSVAQPRPTLETYKYPMPGEDNVGVSEVRVFDVASKKNVLIKADRFKDQSPSLLRARQFRRPDDDDPPPAQWLSEDSSQLYLGRISRDLKRYDVCVADTATGDVKVLLEERLNTYVEVQQLERLSATGELVHWSERDGWGHYYLFDAEGQLQHQITSGPFSCRRILHVDQDRRVLYFVANGREEDEDPYFEHLYRINLDGTDLRLLTPGDYSHALSASESGRFFVDNFSRVDTEPQSALYNNEGRRLLDLEAADLSLLVEAGFQYPKRFRVKADDSVTDLYGVMYTPFDMDKSRKYPIIAYVYPGPQTEAVPKSFSGAASNVALAQLGFVVIAVGNRGGHPARSKWYHNYGYGNLRNYGLADKKTAIEQLAQRHSYIDLDRIGIFGHSGGGFMSTAAMLVYPDFFKVAVSSAGNHENNVYNRWWSEKHHGVKEVVGDDGEVSFEYDIDKNSELAKNLKGRLLLTTGDVDNNVHPANTLRMVQALIKANKRFDFFIFPGQRHGFGDMNNYWFWLRADYFVEHLLGDHYRPVDMIELTREQELGKGRGR